MALTGNYDYCVELTIDVVREIFHEAFRDETVDGEPMFPHNLGPISQNFSGRNATIYVKVYDDESRPADLTFADEQHIRFSIPFDIDVELDDSPDPTLSKITLRALIGIPGLLDTWEEPAGSGQYYLGVDFAGVQPSDVEIDSLDGVPVIGVENYRNAVHKRYTEIQHIYEQSGARLVLYDGNRDLSLTPPNEATPYEIQVVLETHGADDYIKLTAPFHLTVPLPAPLSGQFESYGRIVFWRLVEDSADETHVIVHMDQEPTDATLQTQIHFDTTPDTGDKLNQIRNMIRDRYALITHEIPIPPGFGPSGRFLVYNNNDDATLDPTLPVSHIPYEIDAVLETYGSSEYVKITVPIYADMENVPFISVYQSFGRVIFWRELVDDPMAGTITVNMGIEPSDPSLATQVEFDSGLQVVKDAIGDAVAGQIPPVLAAFGVIVVPGFTSLENQMMPQVLNALANFGEIVEPKFSQNAAETLLREQVANYLQTRKFPVYTPVSPDPEQAPLDKPVGRLLVAPEILAILFNQRSGEPGSVSLPDDFTNGNRLAVAIGRDRALELIRGAIEDEFENINTDKGHKIPTDEGTAWLKKLNITPHSAGAHGESEGHMWVTGEAEVEIDCWPDPDVEFEGPLFIDATQVIEDGECELEMEARVGDFDFDQSCCDVFIDVIIPIVGWIMYFIIESTVDSVGGAVAGEIADNQEDIIEPVPPVVVGVALITACLTDFLIESGGFILPGTIDVRRDTRSYDDLEMDRALPRPDR